MKGIAASKGIAIGHGLIWRHEKPVVEKKDIVQVDHEIERFVSACDLSKKQLKAIQEKVFEEIGPEEAQVFDAHLLLFDDPEWTGRIKQEIMAKRICAEYVTKEVSAEIVALFEAIDDDYLRGRASDIQDVSLRLIKNILGINVGLSEMSQPSIIVAEDLTPSETAQLDSQMVLGFITEQGNKTSHSAIIARTMNIPAIVGAIGIMNELQGQTDVKIAMNGETGTFDINPDDELSDVYQALANDYKKRVALQEKCRGLSSSTLDGHKVELAGNIANPQDAQQVMAYDGEGVGLFRSEFLFMDTAKAPSEEDQYQAYLKAAKILDGRPLVIRTLDAGGDKNISYLNVDEEMNPFLGYRAIRICLKEIELFKTQIRAILRVSGDYPVKMMFPMIATVNEFIRAKAIVNEVMNDLSGQGINYHKDMEIGIMVEIPSTAVMADLFADHVDFFSIGTNDLTQYTLAADRMNPNLSDLYNHRDPAVLRLINMVIKAAHNKGKWVGMCGEAAGDELMIPILLGMGLDEFSMAPSSILAARSIIRKANYAKLKVKAENILLIPQVSEVEKYMCDVLKEINNG